MSSREFNDCHRRCALVLLPAAPGGAYQPPVRRFGWPWGGLWLSVALNLTPELAFAGEPPESSAWCGELTASERAEFEVRATSAFLAAGLEEPTLTPVCTSAKLQVQRSGGSSAEAARGQGRLVDELLELVTELIDRMLREHSGPASTSVAPAVSSEPSEPAPSPSEPGSDQSSDATEAALEPIEVLRPEVASPSGRPPRSNRKESPPPPIAKKSKSLGSPEFRFALGVLGALWATEVVGALGVSLSEHTMWSHRFGFSAYLVGLVGLEDAGGFRAFLGSAGIGPEGHLGRGFGLNGGVLVSLMHAPSPVEDYRAASSVQPGAYFNVRFERALSFGTGFVELGAQLVAVRRELRRGDVLEQTIPAIFPTLSFGFSTHLFGPRSSQGHTHQR